MNKNKKIGVFDSGLGGISVLKELVKQMPNEEYIYFGDSLHAPYGIKKKEEIIKRCIYICDFFIKEGVKAIVVACNTATSAAIEILRKKYINIPIIGMEPALKVAAYGKTDNNIIVMATILTLKEKKFSNLMRNYEKDNNIIKMPCPELVEIIEAGQLENEKLVYEQLEKYFSIVDINKINSIVLGCTHFSFYRKYIERFLTNNTLIIDGNLGTARNLKRLLELSNTLNTHNNKNEYKIKFVNSSNDEKYIRLSNMLFEL